jgi:hypothetical protein
MRTKGHQFRTYRKPDPGAQAAQASMAFQTPPAAPGPGEDTCRAAEVLNLRAEAATGKTVITPVDMPTGNLDLGTVDTTPGARCALAPPAGVDLTPGDYRDLMRLRYRTSPAHRQHMTILARRIGYTPCVGPWAAEARKILEAIGP